MKEVWLIGRLIYLTGISSFGTTVITATCRATGETASTTISVESGWWIWDTRNEFGEWTVQGQATNGPKIERKDGKLVVTLGSGSKRRADLRLPVNDKNPLYLDIATYPVFAMRCDRYPGQRNLIRRSHHHSRSRICLGRSSRQMRKFLSFLLYLELLGCQ